MNYVHKLKLPDQLTFLPDAFIVREIDGIIRNYSTVTEAQLDRYYTGPWYTATRDYHDDQIRHETVATYLATYVDRDAAILEVGAGDGGLYHEMRRRGYKNYAAAPYKTTTLGEYDLIILSHVLEHVLDPQSFIKELPLKENGLLYIEVPDAARYLTHAQTSHGYINFEHINHFTYGSLYLTLKECGYFDYHLSMSVNKLSADWLYPVLRGMWSKTKATVQATVPYSSTTFEQYLGWSANQEVKLRQKLARLKGSKVIVRGMSHRTWHVLTWPEWDDIEIIAYLDSNLNTFSKLTYDGRQINSPQNDYLRAVPYTNAKVVCIASSLSTANLMAKEYEGRAICL